MRRGAFRIISARAVYKYIAFSEVFEHLAVYFLYICLIKHVALIGFGITARRGNFVGYPFCRLFVSIKQRHLIALSCQKLGKARAQHAARACYYNYLFPYFFSFSTASKSPFIYAAPSALSKSP